MKERLRQFMLGRYGLDPYGQFLTILSMVLLVTGTLTYPVIVYAGFALFIYQYFRLFSKNIYKRNSENQKYMALQNRVTGWFAFQKLRISGRKTHRYYRCPSCRQTLRVPKGKGNLTITCTSCRTSFTGKS